MSKKNNLLIAASGTGGHIFPALAVSKEVEDEWNIHWLGLSHRLDAHFIPKIFLVGLLDFNLLIFHLLLGKSLIIFENWFGIFWLSLFLKLFLMKSKSLVFKAFSRFLIKSTFKFCVLAEWGIMR